MGKVGLGTSSPSYSFVVSGTFGNLYYDPSNIDGPIISSKLTDSSKMSRISINDEFSKELILGIIGSSSQNPEFGTFSDSYLYASSDLNGLNIINKEGNNTEDYIRIYAGKNSNNNIPDIHIQGTTNSGIDRGSVGIGTTNSTHMLTIGRTGKGGDLSLYGTNSGYVAFRTRENAGTWSAVLPDNAGHITEFVYDNFGGELF